MAKTDETIIAYKGFDQDLKCRGFQYEIGKEYELPKGEKPEVCSNGFHACESPLEVFDHYFLDDNANLARFCVVELSGEFSKEENSTKVASSKIKIKEEITFANLIESGVEWLKEKTSPEKVVDDVFAQIASSVGRAQIASSGYSAKIASSEYNALIASSGNYTQIGSSGNYAQIGSSGDNAKIASLGNYAQIGSSGNYVQIASSGYYAQIASSGNYTQIGSSGYNALIGSSGDNAQIASSGNYALIDSTGEDSVIMCAGRNSRAKANKGSWITLAEWHTDNSCGKMKPKCVKTEYVDGERIKADTWYKLVDGEFVETNE